MTYKPSEQANGVLPIIPLNWQQSLPRHFSFEGNGTAFLLRAKSLPCDKDTKSSGPQLSLYSIEASFSVTRGLYPRETSRTRVSD